jgi:hypothetical protein
MDVQAGRLSNGPITLESVGHPNHHGKKEPRNRGVGAR